MKKYSLIAIFIITLSIPSFVRAQFLPLAATSLSTSTQKKSPLTPTKSINSTDSGTITPSLNNLFLSQNKTYKILYGRIKAAKGRLNSIFQRLSTRIEKVKKAGNKITKPATEQKNINVLLSESTVELEKLSPEVITNNNYIEVKTSINSLTDKLNKILMLEKALFTELSQYSKGASPSGSVIKK